ncbi:PilN domain-containing protein [Methylomicrobium sp. Wu6]|uniref:PilN domain-containing protein n=1 Tax=Methylomicrobium sp. Wu6 TaxID=3107928 RepID=UPI002DD6501F|nr:PilN domain-containing protein [Methylomicrobium sp. Wu6]MEC4748778.1 PilN domain-containing protein [Methylomicrobium sp. Wu6]
MLNLNSTIELDFKKFFRWWRKELAFLVPEKLRLLLSDKHDTVIVKTKGNQFELTHVGDTTETLAVLSRNEEGAAQFNELLAKDERLAKAHFVLRLQRTEGICRELALPAAARENLTQVVAYELSRFTPFKPEQVYFAVKLLNTAGEPGLIQVALILTPREVLDGLYADLTAIGISPQLADYEGVENDPEQIYDAYDLLPEWHRTNTGKSSNLINAALAGAIILLLAGVLFLPVFFEYQTVTLLQEKIDGIEKDAKKIKGMQAEIDDAIAETEDLIKAKNASPPVIEMLNTLSALIKDDTTWLTYLQFTDGHLQIQGESPSASGLIAVLEDSEIFANAKFVSPVTQDATTGFERFQITADIVKAEESGEQRKK